MHPDPCGCRQDHYEERCELIYIIDNDKKAPGEQTRDYRDYSHDHGGDKYRQSKRAQAFQKATCSPNILVYFDLPDFPRPIICPGIAGFSSLPYLLEIIIIFYMDGSLNPVSSPRVPDVLYASFFRKASVSPERASFLIRDYL
jgi:hypothetical protein